MGFARLNVWVHDVQDPCRISDRTWRINVTDCQNRIVSYCGRRYANLPARCGHLELRLPPGCYIVWGALSVHVAPKFVYANYVTHFAFVNVDCHETACVHLYAPTYKKCWRAFVLATRLIAEQKGFKKGGQDEVEQFLRLGERLAGQAPAAAGDDEFAEQTEELVKSLREEEPDKLRKFDERFERDES
jgi:hypothetical protein